MTSHAATAPGVPPTRSRKRRSRFSMRRSRGRAARPTRARRDKRKPAGARIAAAAGRRRSGLLDLPIAVARRVLPQRFEVALAIEHLLEPCVPGLGLVGPCDSPVARRVLYLGIELDDLVAALAEELERLRVLVADAREGLEGHQL